MEIHFYESLKACLITKDIRLDWVSTKSAIESEIEEIHTIQMCMLSTTLLLDGYRVFVHQDDGFMYELTLQAKDNKGDRTVRPSQHMYAMWANNLFREWSDDNEYSF